ncbi:MAG: putative toxin-antitoxin system toxin component, PIN family [Chloroflexi bacterium]|nr:putative toxin-antitoxin system toxin component, PIN family [Chloroflexota bacterium]
MGKAVVLKTIPPRCRDPKDHPVLATAIDGHADAIVSGDDDLRDDEALREAMADYGVQLCGELTRLYRLLKTISQCPTQ